MKTIDIVECKEALNSLYSGKLKIEKKEEFHKEPLPTAVEIFKQELNWLDAELDRQFKTLPKKKEDLFSVEKQITLCNLMINKFTFIPEKLNYWQSKKQRLLFEKKILKSELEKINSDQLRLF